MINLGSMRSKTVGTSVKLSRKSHPILEYYSIDLNTKFLSKSIKYALRNHTKFKILKDEHMLPDLKSVILLDGF